MTNIRAAILAATGKIRAGCTDLEAIASVDRPLTEEETDYCLGYLEEMGKIHGAITQRVYMAMRAIWDAPESAEAATPVAGVGT